MTYRLRVTARAVADADGGPAGTQLDFVSRSGRASGDAARLRLLLRGLRRPIPISPGPAIRSVPAADPADPIPSGRPAETGVFDP